MFLHSRFYISNYNFNRRSFTLRNPDQSIGVLKVEAVCAEKLPHERRGKAILPATVRCLSLVWLWPRRLIARPWCRRSALVHAVAQLVSGSYGGGSDKPWRESMAGLSRGGQGQCYSFSCSKGRCKEAKAGKRNKPAKECREPSATKV